MKVICYGDSNTYGYDPRSRAGESYPASVRWVDILAGKTHWNVINDGQNGREIPTEPVTFPLDTDLLIVMLGTNDLLQLSFPEDAAHRMEQFLTTVNLPREKLLVLAPPAMVPGEWVQDDSLIEDCAALTRLYRDLCGRLGIRFLDTTPWNIRLCYDGVHFTEEGSVDFGSRLAEELMPPCVSVEDMRISDAYTIANFVPSLTLMHRAAEGVFHAAAGWAAPVAILAGSGNNGGDGFALACILAETGIPCTVFTVSDRLSADSAFYAEKARGIGVPIVAFQPDTEALTDFSTVVDCLLGTGFHGTPRENYAAAIAAINRFPGKVVSVDINSGMNGDTGEGETVVSSHLTVTIGMLKPGLLSPNAGKAMQELVCVDIGIGYAPEVEPVHVPAPYWLKLPHTRKYDHV
ncbi:MAG: NAD(P)H-hydrate epimerase [Oscillospiraceae bacterium]|nr:NAD(P)H-hydrate epimerase [Oscillospiraceae bacterium]